MTSGVPAFNDIPYDFNLFLDICQGLRPEIIKGTMPEYVDVMKRCWDSNPDKRPTAEELKNYFKEWSAQYECSYDERIPVPSKWWIYII